MRREIKAGALLLAASFLLVLFCSQCSPLYPVNIWDDANCLLTVGRLMKSGRVLYREIYEQKGPTLYLWHALAAVISDRSFLGVFLLETVHFWGFLLGIYGLMKRRLRAEGAFLGAVLLGAAAVSCGAFLRGDSAEEFCLPMTALLLFLMEEDPGQIRGRRLFAMGLLAGLVATVKYTLLGVFLGACLWLAPVLVREKRMKEVLWFAMGMGLPIAAWCLYFAAHGALADFYTAYLYNNIARYAGQGRMTPGELASVIKANLTWIVPLVLGVILDRERRFILPLAVQTLVLLLAGRMWPYSPLILVPFGCYGLRALLERLGRDKVTKWKALALAAAACAAAAVWTPNAFLRFVPLSETAQGRLAERMGEGALLQYSHLDDGLYLVSGKLPQERYFVRLNVEDPEMTASLDRQVRERQPRYVLMTWRPLPDAFSGYRLIAYDTGYDDAGRLNKDFYLYEREDAP